MELWRLNATDTAQGVRTRQISSQSDVGLPQAHRAGESAHQRDRRIPPRGGSRGSGCGQCRWNLGRSNLNTIWLHQHVGGFDRFVCYYKKGGEFIGHYLAWLREWAGERRASFGGHFIPHDGDRESLWLEGGTRGVMSSLGFHPTIVERPRNKLEAIAAARAACARCQSLHPWR